MDRSDIRRLEKAAKDKNKLALAEWGYRFEEQIKNELKPQYEKWYQEQLDWSVDNLSLAVAYTFMYSEHTSIKAEELPNFMEDLFVTINMFSTGEFKPEDYAEEMRKYGVHIDDIIKKRKEIDNGSKN